MDQRIVSLKIEKSPRDEIVEKLRYEYKKAVEEERMKKKDAEELAKIRAGIKKKIDLIEKSVFKRKYTYDINGEILEVKNRHKPKKGALFVHMK